MWPLVRYQRIPGCFKANSRMPTPDPLGSRKGMALRFEDQLQYIARGKKANTSGQYTCVLPHAENCGKLGDFEGELTWAEKQDGYEEAVALQGRKSWTYFRDWLYTSSVISHMFHL